MSDPWDAFSRKAPVKSGPPRWIIEKHKDDRPDTGHGETVPADAVAEKFQCVHCQGDIYYSKVVGVHLHWRNARRYCKGTKGRQAVPDNIVPLIPEPLAKPTGSWDWSDTPNSDAPF